MRIPRFYLPADYQAGLQIPLSKEQAHYALTVLRLKNGHQIEVFDGQGQRAFAQLYSQNRREAQVQLQQVQSYSIESPLNTVLVQAISRGERMDYSLQKAVELGISAIQPVFTERCEVRLDEEKSGKRRQQWQALVISACEQSGRTVVPPVYPPLNLADWLEERSPTGIILDPYGQTTLSQITAPTPSQPWHILIGPEGGFSDDEVKLAQAHGLIPLRLGGRILRTETAAPVILAMVQSRWGDLN
jgi:16S rRNA (uracil1498-N3)-methyltransferase